MAYGVPMLYATAASFFTQLAEFSRRVMKQWKLPETGSPWGQPQMAANPQGAILHFTAGTTLEGAVTWFCDPTKKSDDSAHAVVSDHLEPWAMELAYDLPLIRALPTTVVQCRAPTAGAYHATWANHTCYGIENVNVGEIRQSAGQYVWSAGDWKEPYRNPGKPPVALYNRLWEPYTLGQAQSNAYLVEAVHALFSGSLKPAWVVGHENVQGVHTAGAHGHDKRDLGPAFPLHAVRRAAFDTRAPVYLSALTNIHWRETYVTRWIGQNAQTPHDAWERFLSWIQSSASMPGDVKAMLHVLGYAVSDPMTTELSPEDGESVGIFQRMMGLPIDKTPGPQTRQALVARVLDRLPLAAAANA